MDKVVASQRLLEASLDRANKGQSRTRSASDIVWGRARAELLYVDALQEWVSKTNDIVNKSGFEYSSILIQLFRDMLTESRATVKLHHDMYTSVMAEDGPYIKLCSDSSDHKNNSKSNQVDVSAVAKQYNDLKEQRTLLFERQERWEKQIERHSSFIQRKEAELGAMSTRAKRAEQLNRDLGITKDPMIMPRSELKLSEDRLSSTNQLIDEHGSIEREELSKMTDDLQRLEKERIVSLVEQLTSLKESLDNLEKPELRYPRNQAIRHFENDLNCLDVDDITETWYEDTTKSISRALEKPRQKSLMELIRGSKSVPMSVLSDKGPENAPRQRSSSFYYEDTNKDSGLTNVEVTSSPTQLEKSGSDQADVAGDVSLIHSFYDRSFECLASIDLKEDHLSDGSCSDLETIDAGSPERKKVKEAEFVAREFCCQQDSDPSLLDAEERLAAEMINGVHVSHVLNIRVKIKADYTAKSKGELTLKQGQIVKQKIPMNGDGLCYGWTRSHKLALKKYGYYPGTIVIPYRRRY